MSGCTAPRILNLGSEWRCVVSITSRTLYPQRKQLEEAGWSPETVGIRRRRQKSVLPGNRVLAVQPTARSLH